MFNLRYPKSKSDWIRYLTSVNEIVPILERNNFDIVVCYNYPSGGLIDILRKRQKHHFKAVFDLTEWYEATTGSTVFRFLKALDVFLRIRLIANCADGLILASTFLDTFYEKFDHKIVVPTLVLSQPASRNI